MVKITFSINSVSCFQNFNSFFNKNSIKLKTRVAPFLILPSIYMYTEKHVTLILLEYRSHQNSFCPLFIYRFIYFALAHVTLHSCRAQERVEKREMTKHCLTSRRLGSRLAPDYPYLQPATCNSARVISVVYWNDKH